MRLGLALALTLATAAQAQEFVVTEGPLSDDAFYRLVACAAPLGGDCAKPMAHWPTDRALRVALEPIPRAFLGGKAKRADAALIRALQRLNATGMGLRLIRVQPDQTPDIRILFLDTPAKAMITGTGIEGLDGETPGGASARIWRDNTGTIQRAVIAFSNALHMRSYESAMLEELTQSLGLMTDIRNPYYDSRSIFSQDSNSSTRLGAQDIMSLLRHYPAR